MNTLSQEALAERWRVSPWTLQRWRRAGVGPNFCRSQGRIVYPLADVERYEKNRLYYCTSHPLREGAA